MHCIYNKKIARFLLILLNHFWYLSILKELKCQYRNISYTDPYNNCILDPTKWLFTVSQIYTVRLLLHA